MTIKITKQQIIKIILLVAALAVVIAVPVVLLNPAELWANGVDITKLPSSDSAVLAGHGRISYDRQERALVLSDATVSQNHNTSAIYARGDLTLRLEGDNILLGENFGILVYGDLHIIGEGTLTVWGSDTGIYVTGAVTVEEGADIVTHGGNAALSAEDGLNTAGVHRLQAGSGEKDAVLGADWSGSRWIHIHAPVSLSFTGNGGDEPETVHIPWGDPMPYVEDSQREGYYFDGWFTDRSAMYAYTPGIAAVEDTMLYAAWTKIVYISYDSWGGSEMPVSDIPIGTALSEPEPPTRVDQTFAGWYADDDLEVPFDFSRELTEDITLYAKWDKDCDAMAYGVDVSSWQRDIDWQAVADEGIQFAIMRAGFRGYGAEGTLNEDDYFRQNMEGAIAAGLDVGCYFYCQSTTPEEAVEEAEYLIGLIGDLRMTLPVFLDFEVPVNDKGEEIGRLAQAALSGEEHAAICLAFCRRIEEAGFTAMVYAGKGHLYQDDMAGILDEAGYGVWLAHWRMQTNYSGRYEYWQYSATGSVAGISGDVDMDIRYITVPDKVQNLTAVYNNEDLTVSLSWERVPGVYGYIVERLDPVSGQWSEVGRVIGAGITAYLDEDPALVMGTVYSYRVSAFLTQSGTDYVGEASDEAEVVVGTLPEPAEEPDPAAMPDEGTDDTQDAPGGDTPQGEDTLPDTEIDENSGGTADNTQEEQT